MATQKYSKEYYKANKERFRDYANQYKQDNFETIMLTRSKHRAKAKGLDFDLELSDIVIPDVCPYLKTEITKILGGGFIPTNPSLDRIDPSKGYVKGNVQVISCLANTMKNSAELPLLIQFAKSVLEIHR